MGFNEVGSRGPHCQNVRLRAGASLCLGWLSGGSVLCFLAVLNAQTPEPAPETERPVPILTGNAGFFTNVNGGETELVPSITPVLLVPLGDRWLVESRAEFKGEFERDWGTGPYGGKVEQEIDYLQLDYIANRYLTVTAGRFLTPFGIYNERLYPIWIRSLQPTPLIFPLGTGSSDGVMLRGGFSLNPKVNLNYATYFSTLSTMNKFESDRLAGGRVGFFLPGPRIEAGRLLSKGIAGGAGQRLWISFCLAACRASAQSALRVRALARWQRLLDRSRLPPEPGALLAEGAAPHRNRGPRAATVRRRDR